MPVKAFPTAYGFGVDNNIGGRGGPSVAVTNTNDSGVGSLRAALQATGSRHIIPRVGGIVALESNIVITDPYFSYHGQVAPGGGLLVKNYNVQVSTHDGIVRFLRSFPGDGALGGGRNTNAFLVSGGGGQKYNITADHCSVGFSTDQNFDASGHWNDITYQWCLIAEPRATGGGPTDNPSYSGSLFYTNPYQGQMSLSLHHCVYACNKQRNPLCGPYLSSGGGIYGAPGMRVDMRNCLIYNWLGNNYTTFATNHANATNYNNWLAASGGNPGIEANVVGCRWVRGPSSVLGDPGGIWVYPHVKLFAANNMGPGNSGTPTNGFNPLVNHLTRRYVGEANQSKLYGTYDPTPFIQLTEFPFPFVPTHDATDIFALLTQQAGCILPSKDTLWARIMNDVVNNTGTIADHNDYPTLAAGTALTASQPDLIPDAWKVAYGLNAATDYTGVQAPSGYDWVEVWANEVAGDGFSEDSAFFGRSRRARVFAPGNFLLIH